MATTVPSLLGNLGKGVVVTNVATKTAHGGWNIIEIEMQVDPREIDAFTNILQGLRTLMNPPQNFALTTQAYPPTLDDYEEEEGDWTVAELDANDGVPIEDVTLESLKALIEERFDGMEQAVRLALGE